MSINRTIHNPLILVVEDDEDDRDFIREALEDADLPCQLRFARDGVDALEQLDSLDRLPTLILCDVNMPRLDGFGLLDHLRASPRLRCLPVVMFSTSGNNETVATAFERGANSYVTKPTSYFDFSRVLGEVRSYWLNLSRVPEHQYKEGCA
jgi:CheY-like chemotaxis protein